METRMLLIAAAAIGALGVGYLAIAQISAAIRAKNVVLYARGETPSVHALCGLQLETGVGFLVPVSARLLKIRPVCSCAESLTEAARAKGVATTPQTLLSVLVLVCTIVFVIVSVLTGNAIAGFAVAACGLALVVVWSGSVREKQQNLMREEIPGVLELMTACFGLGFSLLQTFQQIADNVSGQLGALFGKAAHILETGGSMSQALDLLRRRIDIPELAFVVAALEVQHRNGGSITQVLEGAAESVKSELALKRSLHVQTAQAKLSARVVIVMPFVLIALFSLVSPGFLAPFFSSVAGYALLSVALLMQIGGIVLVRRTLDIEGVA